MVFIKIGTAANLLLHIQWLSTYACELCFFFKKFVIGQKLLKSPWKDGVETHQCQTTFNYELGIHGFTLWPTLFT